MEDNKEFQLTHLQQMAIPTIMWLIDEALTGGRATGRTTAMAYAFIIKALQNPSKKVQVWDHYSTDYQSKQNMLNAIRHLFPLTSFVKENELFVYMNDSAIQIVKRETE